MKRGTSVIRRRRATYIGRRGLRIWFTHEGSIVRLLSFEDYSPCAQGASPRSFYKLLTHSRYARGMRITGALHLDYLARVAQAIVPGAWTEVRMA